MSLRNLNSRHHCVVAYPIMQDFLSADTHIAIHPTTVPDPAQSLDCEADMNGVVFEMARVRGLHAGLHYLPTKAEVTGVALCVLEKALGLEPNIGSRVEGLDASVWPHHCPDQRWTHPSTHCRTCQSPKH